MGTLKQNGDLLGTQNRKNVPHGEQCLWVPVYARPSNNNSLIDFTDVTLVDEDVNLILNIDSPSVLYMYLYIFIWLI